MTTTTKSDRTTGEVSGLSWKQIGAMLAGLAALSTLHASYVVPTIMTRVSKVVDEKLETHMKHVHPDAVSHRELELTVGQVNAKLDAIKEELQRVSKSLDKRSGD